MNLRPLRSRLLIACLFSLVACAGPRSEVEVYHLRDLVRDGRVEYLSELVIALDSKDETVRSSAIRSLAELGEVAEPRLKQTVREQSGRSGAALLALGFGGNAENLEFVRGYTNDTSLGAAAKEAEREIERRLYKRVQNGELDAMEQYLEAFPESQKAEEIKKVRRVRLAKQSWERVAASPTVADLEEYLRVYGDTEDASMARATLGRLLVKEVNGRIELQEFQQAREIAARIPAADVRRQPEAERLIAQAYLLEGKAHRAGGRDDQALLALEQAGKHPDFRLESERLRADILMVQARARIQSGNVREGVILADRAAQIDAVRRPEVAAIKSELALTFQAKIQGQDPVQRRLALVGLLSLGEDAAKPMELYLGNLFARKDYAGVEEVVQALAEARRNTPNDVKNVGVERVGEMLVNYLRAALVASTADVQRLFGAPEFIKHWTNDLNPVDPREFPLIYKVEELTTRHLGLSRVGLATKALLGEGGLDVVRGTLLPEDEVRNRLVQGQIGNDAALPLLTRVQLCARYAGVMGEFSRSVEGRPERFMAYAVGLTLPPTTTADWLQVAEGFKDVTARNPQPGRVPAANMAGGLRDGRVSLISLDYDQRSLTIQAYDPVVDTLASNTPEVRAEAMVRTTALLLNTARIAFGLYAGIDRYTVLIGSTETPLTSISQVRGGRFDPETRMMLSQKGFGKLDWQKIRAMNGSYGPAEGTLVDLSWNRWTR